MDCDAMPRLMTNSAGCHTRYSSLLSRVTSFEKKIETLWGLATYLYWRVKV